MGTMVLVGLIAKLTSTLTLRALTSVQSCPVWVLRRYAWARRLHWMMWVLATALIGAMLLGAADSPDQLNSITFKLAMVASWGVAWLLSWSAFYDVERHFGSTSYEAHSRARYIACRARFYFGLVIMPATVAWLWCEITYFVATQYAMADHAGWVFVGGLMVFCIAFPPLLVRIWPTRPLPEGELREQLMNGADRAGVEIRQILVWDTHGTMCNAAYTGILRRWNYVLLTDSLLDRLDTHETRAAFYHELAHIRLCHTRKRLTWLAAPLGGWYLASCLGAHLAANWPSTASWLNRFMENNAPWLELALTFYLPLGFVAIFMSLCLRWLSRSLEIEADQWAVSTLQYEWGPNQAVAIYQSMLRKVGRGATARGSWSHPSMVKRLRSVELLGDRVGQCQRILPRYGNRHNRYIPN